jgi:hypothetical protein
MLQEAMHDCHNVDRFHAAAKLYHLTMLTHVPEITPPIYEHALLVHVPSVLSSGRSCWMAAHGSLRPTIRCGSINCFTTVMLAAEEQKNWKGKLRAKLGVTGSWQRGLQEKT